MLTGGCRHSGQPLCTGLYVQGQGPASLHRHYDARLWLTRPRGVTDLLLSLLSKVSHISCQGIVVCQCLKCVRCQCKALELPMCAFFVVMRCSCATHSHAQQQVKNQSYILSLVLHVPESMSNRETCST